MNVNSKRLIGTFVFCGAFFMGFYILMSAPGRVASTDSVYHFTEAGRIASGDVVPDPSENLPHTVYRDMPVDHYWGFHAVLAPFTLIEDKEIGMKVAASVGFAAIILGIFLFVSAAGAGTAMSLLAAAGALMFGSLVYRYLMLRGAQLVLPLMLIHLWLAFGLTRTGSYWRKAGLFALPYVSMLGYHGAFLLAVFHMAGVGALWLSRHPNRRPFSECGLTVLGLVSGLTLNPYMDAQASTWKFFWYHVFYMGGDRENLYAARGGSEFQPMTSTHIAANPEYAILFALVAAVAVYMIVMQMRKQTVSVTELGMAAVALTASALCAHSIRMIEYAVPLSLAFLAIASVRVFKDRVLVRTAAVTVLILFVVAPKLNARASETISFLCNNERPISMYAGARNALEQVPGGVVLNEAEMDCALLLFEDPGAKCLHGLSLYFLFYDRELYESFWKLYRGEGSQLEQLMAIAELWDGRGVRFVAARTFREDKHGVFRRPVLNDLATSVPGIFQPVYTDRRTGYAVLYRINRPALAAALAVEATPFEHKQ